MSGQELSDVCRQIAAEQADRLIRAEAPGAGGSDPVALIGRLDAYADAFHELSDGVLDEASEDPSR